MFSALKILQEYQTNTIGMNNATTGVKYHLVKVA